jgi:hypothetical protein
MIARLPLVVIVAALIHSTCAGETNVQRFDFGTAGSKVGDGFTKVTHQSEFTTERGYGFRSTAGLAGRDRGGWQFGPSGRDSSVTTHDFVEGVAAATLRVRVGPGKHIVWVAVSDRLEAPPWFDIYCNGTKVQEVRVPRREFVWFEPFEAEARDGLLDITFQGEHGFLINAIVIGADPATLQPIIDAIERDIFFLPPEQQQHWKLIERPAAGPPYDPLPVERETGYVVFSTPYSVPIYRDTAPLPEQVRAPLRTIVAPGEMEPASCCVMALRDLSRVVVEVSDLTADSGATITSNHVNVGIVRCWPQRMRGGMESSGTYMIKPELIEPPAARNSSVSQGTCKQWWLTLQVPPTAEPGLYRGTVKFRPEQAAAVAIPWLVRVLPFTLDRPTDRHWGTWWDGAAPPLNEIRGPAGRGRNTEAEREAYAREEVADFRDHGFDVAILDCSYDVKEIRHADGTWSFTLGSFKDRMNAMKELKAPFTPVTSEYYCRRMEHRYADDKPHLEGRFSPTARSACVSMFRFLDAEAKRNGWPPIIHMPIDEPGNNKSANRMRFGQQVLDMVREAGGQTGCTLTDSVAANLGDRVRTRIYAWGHFNVARARAEAERGFPFWFYQNSIMYGESTLRSRGMTGFEFYRSGAQCATGWGFCAWRGNPHNDFDSASEDWFVLLPGVRKPTPTIYWELCREGVDDVRYLTTLRNAIDAAPDRSDPRVAAARQVLDGIVSGEEIAYPEMFDRLRWRVAEQILSLKGHGDRPEAFVSESRAIEWGENLFTNPGWESGRAEPCFLNYPPALTISQDVVHGGKYSLRWSGADATDAPSYEGKRLLVVNVNVPAAAARQLAGKLVKVGLWVRVDGGRLALAGARLRCFKTENGQSVYAGGIEANSGIEDFSVWNKLEGIGTLPPDSERLDLHLSCSLPDDPALRDVVRFYIDDLFLQAHTPAPLSLELTQDEWFVGEVIRGSVTHHAGAAALSVSLLHDRHTVRHFDLSAAPSSFAVLPTDGLAPGIYTLVVSGELNSQSVEARGKIRLAASPFE